MAFGRNVLGVTPLLASVGSGTATATFSMIAVNSCVSFRFIAPDARDVAGVWINWASVTAGGTVRVRIETDSSGKPSGTLYDANATVDITPVAGWQQCTFATLPTAGLVAGNLYHVLLITTVAGTTQSVRQSWAPVGGGAYPLNALTATDGSTRTNLVENSATVPVCTLVFEDGVEDARGFAPFATASNFTVYGTRAAGAKLVVPTGVTFSVVGVTAEGPLRNGTPDDLRVRILDSGNALVSGATVTLARAGLLNASGRRLFVPFPAAVSLPAGTYRVVWDQQTGGGTSSTTSGNNWQLWAATYRSSALAPSYWMVTTTTDVTVGSPTWTDTSTDVPLIGLQLNDASGPGGGGTTFPMPPIRSNTYAFIG